jgi:hypothetical protein
MTMRTFSRFGWVVIGLGAWSAGCTGDVVVFGSGGTTGSGTNSGTTSAASMTTSGASMNTGVTAGVTTGASMTTAGVGGSGVCQPAPGESQCTTCAKQNCCNDVTACDADMNCTCWIVCNETNPGNPQACFQQCGAPDATTQALAQCAGMACQNECGPGTTTTTTTSGVSTGTGGNMCPPMPGDSQCTQCAKMNCCSDVNACQGDMTCTCWVGCLGQGGTFQSCTQLCGQTDMTTNALFQCAGTQCQGMCP